MKDILKKVKDTFIKIWNNDPKDILVPTLSILIFIVSIFLIGVLKGLILLVAINFIYFTVNLLIIKNYNKKKRKNNKDSKKKNNNNNKKKNSKNSKGEAIMKKASDTTIKSKKKKKSTWKKVIKILLLIFLLFFILGVIAVILFFSYIVKNAPEFDEKLLYMSEPSIILDKNGEKVGEIGAEKRDIITYDEIPEVLIDAIVATEDSRFFEHKGVDWARFIKATLYQVLGKPAGGASTLTMQVSKNRYTSTEAEGFEGIVRKFTDVYVSMNILEKKYSKEQIMEFYVNYQWLAKNTFGVEKTALRYFGKNTKNLNLAEAAMIAGLFQAPGKYDPYDNPEATEKRRQQVLNLMLRHEYISEEEYNIAKKMTVDKIVIPKENNPYITNGLSDYQSFIDTVIEEVIEKTGKNPSTTPMTIYTTLDTDIQNYVNNIMNGTSYEWENDKAQAGIAIVNVKDGSVAALGGNRNIDTADSWNFATDIERQIGSTAKPLYDYGPAIEYNNWSSYHIIVDEPSTYSDGHSINNWDGQFQGFETMRAALAASRNIPALKTFKANNKQQIIEFTTSLGLTPEIYSCKEGYSLVKNNRKLCKNNENESDIIDAIKDNTLHEAHSIGGYNGESPLSMASAYAAFANNGIYIEPYTFTKIVFKDTNEEFINDIKKTKAMSEETAYIISDMLTTTAVQALTRYYNINGIRYAAKTGTTNYDDNTAGYYKLPYNAVNDLWTVGYNTEYSIGVWYGYDTPKEGYNRLDNPQHTRLFQAVGKKVFTNNAPFSRPSGVVAVEVESGCPEASLPSEFTPKDLRQTELFIRGTEPTTVSTRFQKLSDIKNLKATSSDNKVTLTWTEVPMPEINTENYLKKYFGGVFTNTTYLNNHIKDRMAYIKRYVGDIGYNIYKKDADGTLTLLDYVNTNKYETTVDESGEYTYVVKTAYSIFKQNMSDGIDVSIDVTVSSPIIPEKPSEKPSEGNTGNNNSTTSSGTQNNR